jgi:hypothetical protein
MPFDFDVHPAIAAALEEVAVEVHQRIIDKIETPDWEWPRETYRKNKSISPRPTRSPRDIVDLGTLRDSQQWAPVDYGGGTVGIEFYNTAEHSNLVHEGGHNGNNTIRKRPFMRDVLKEINIQQMVADKLSATIQTTKDGRLVARDERGRFTYSKGLGNVDASSNVTDFDGDSVNVDP